MNLVLSLVKHVWGLGAGYQDWADRMMATTCDRLSMVIATFACEQLIVPQLCRLHCKLLIHSTPQNFLTSQKRRNYYTSLFAHLASRLHSNCILCLWVVGILAEPTNLGGPVAMGDTIAFSIQVISCVLYIHDLLCTTDIHQFV